MKINKQSSLPKRNSARIIVDEYEQIRRERQQDGICPLCGLEIPMRLMNSHRNVCAFGNSVCSIDKQSKQQSRSEGKMAFSTYANKQLGKSIQKNTNRVSTQTNGQRNNQSGLSHKKKSSKKLFRFDSTSIRNDSIHKNRKQSQRKVSCSKKKQASNRPDYKIYQSKKVEKNHTVNGKEKKAPGHKSMLPEQYKEYYAQAKPTGISKKKKTIKNVWLEQSTRKKNAYKETEVKREVDKFRRQQKFKKLQKQTDKLHKEQKQILKQLKKEKKKQALPNQRKRSEIKRERQAPETKNNTSHNISNHHYNHERNPSRPLPNRNRVNRNRNFERQRQSREEESYYEEIPINHPHRTINFISQTINEQFEMMKQQFEHMNEFFSNFVPFSNNGFVYFERGQQQDYSLDSSGQSIGYEQQQEQIGLYDEQIQLLPKYSYIKRLGNDDQCAICINSIKHQQFVRRLPCNHIFHSNCIDEWLKRKAVCPVCRDQIKDLGQ